MEQPEVKKTRARVKDVVVSGGRSVYLSNKELLAEVIASKERGQMSDMLAKMLMLLCARYARKGNYVNYSYNTDMQAYAMMLLVKTWSNFNPEKSDNPFAFYTQCIKNSFSQFLNQEKKQRNIRDELWSAQGLLPSQAYQDLNDRSYMDMDDEENLDMQPAVTEGVDEDISDVVPDVDLSTDIEPADPDAVIPTDVDEST